MEGTKSLLDAFDKACCTCDLGLNGPCCVHPGQQRIYRMETPMGGYYGTCNDPNCSICKIANKQQRKIEVKKMTHEERMIRRIITMVFTVVILVIGACTWSDYRASNTERAMSDIGYYDADPSPDRTRWEQRPNLMAVEQHMRVMHSTSH